MLLVLATAAEDTGAHPQQKELPSDVASGPTYAPAKPASAQDDSSEPKLKAPPKSPPLPLPKPPSSSSADQSSLLNQIKTFNKDKLSATPSSPDKRTSPPANFLEEIQNFKFKNTSNVRTLKQLPTPKENDLLAVLKGALEARRAAIEKEDWRAVATSFDMTFDCHG